MKEEEDEIGDAKRDNEQNEEEEVRKSNKKFKKDLKRLGLLVANENHQPHPMD